MILIIIKETERETEREERKRDTITNNSTWKYVIVNTNMIIIMKKKVMKRRE